MNVIARLEFELVYSDSACTFSFLSSGIILWIELPWPENHANTYAWHTETLDSCFLSLIGSVLPWYPPLEIEPLTTECKAETLPLSHKSNAKSTSHSNYAANWRECVLQVTSVLITVNLLVNLASLGCDMDYDSVVKFRLCNLWSLVWHCWRDLIRSKQLSSVSVCRA